MEFNNNIVSGSILNFVETVKSQAGITEFTNSDEPCFINRSTVLASISILSMLCMFFNFIKGDLPYTLLFFFLAYVSVSLLFIFDIIDIHKQVNELDEAVDKCNRIYSETNIHSNN